MSVKRKMNPEQKVVMQAMDGLVKNWKHDGAPMHSVIVFGFSENGMGSASKIHGEKICPMALRHLGKAADELAFSVMLKVAETKIQDIIDRAHKIRKHSSQRTKKA